MKTIQSFFLLTSLLIAVSGEALATWSIVAVDPETKEVGAAAATCTVGIEIIAGVVPGKGVILAQAATNLDARDRAVQMIANGGSAQDVIAQIANEAFNPGDWLYAPWKEQQYGVAVLNNKPRVKNFTGSETVEWSGAIARGNVSVQGNMLYGRETTDATMNAFESYVDKATITKACRPDLADRLLYALAAGARKGADKRCSKKRAALTAFVTVARPEDASDQASLFLVAPKAFGILGSIRHMIFPYTPDENTPPAVDQLQTMYEGWKQQHPDWLTTNCTAKEAENTDKGTVEQN